MFKTTNPSEPKPTPTFTPKPVSREDTAVILESIFAENLTLADTRRNGELIAQTLRENGLELTLENCRKIVQILSYPFDKFDRQKPPVPPPPPQPVVAEPTEPVEILEPGQLSIHASEWQLRQPSVTPAQLKDYLRRVREAEAAK